MLQSASLKHTKLATNEVIVKNIMFDAGQANINDAKSSITEVEKYNVKSNQTLKYWLPELKLTESDNALPLNPLVGQMIASLMLLSIYSKMIITC